MTINTGVAILGMHRGGTSAIAKIVHDLGVFMGDELLPPSEHNKLGYFEDKTIVEFHNTVIGGNWAAPALSRTYRYVDSYKQTLQPFMEHEVWGIKDPRLCYCVPLLMRVVPDTKLITVYRDPVNAARSLAKREDMPYDLAFAISTVYLSRMIENTIGKDVLAIRYIDAITHPVWAARTVASFIGVEVTDAARVAVDSSLAHWEQSDCSDWLNLAT